MKINELMVLAGLFKSLTTFANDEASFIEPIRESLKDAYRTWILHPSKAYNILQILQESNEPFAVNFIKSFEVLLSSMDNIKLETLFDRINDMLEMISTVKEDRSVRHNIHLIYKRPNDRETAKNKFETVVFKNLANILKNQAEVLKKILHSNVKLKGGPSVPEVRNLSMQELKMFIYTPGAQRHGIDNLDILREIIQYPELRMKVTKLVNALNSGHLKANSLELAQEAAEIKANFNNKKTNEFAFENPESDLGNKQLDVSMRKNREEKRLNKIKELEYDPDFVLKQKQQEQEKSKYLEDLDNLNKQEDLINKYNSLSFSDWLKRSKK